MKTLIVIIMFIAAIGCSKDDDTANDNDEPTQVYIYSVISTPTNEESITIKNNSGTEKDLSGWTLGDLNEPDAYSIPNNKFLSHGATTIFSRSTIGFQINDKDEIIYLKDKLGNIVDTWSN